MLHNAGHGRSGSCCALFVLAWLADVEASLGLVSRPTSSLAKQRCPLLHTRKQLLVSSVSSIIRDRQTDLTAVTQMYH